MGIVQRLRLEREGIRFDERGTIRLSRFQWLPRAAGKASRVIVILALLLRASGALAAESHTVRCGSTEYTYLLSTPGRSEPMPALLLLHGAGGHPERMVAAWEAFAARNGIVLVAPDIPLKSTFEPIAPGVFRCVVEDAKTRTKIDPRRVYVFGHSMGGYLTFDTAMFESEYFAAAAVHAGAIAPDYAGIVGFARRKMPILIVSGDKDPTITIESVRWTRDLLVGKGFSVQLIELKDHDHHYEAWADRVNPEVWKFLSQQALPQPP
jgi:poly(3-hydroxybutyrate) depolymerase